MTKPELIRETCDYLMNTCRDIDNNPKIKTEARKKRRIVDEWNWYLQNIIDKTLSDYDKAFYKMFYNTLSGEIVRQLTWTQTKMFIFNVTKMLRDNANLWDM